MNRLPPTHTRPCSSVGSWSLRLAVVVISLTLARLASADEVGFQRDIQPILAERCAHCHGADEATRQANLRLDTRDGALRGGESGEPAVVPGKPEASELLRRVLSKDEATVMPPPDDHEPLTAAQTDMLRQWIASGARYDRHWSFSPPEKADLPGGSNQHPVDAFVRAKLSENDLKLSPVAEPNILCRRLYLDVIGLPPSPEEIQEFERIGFEATLTKLLASPRYGEKWGRHWLDVARYSDTNGYEKDLRREQWIWRDWVIDALNRDLPYNQFIVEQIAGDLLPDATPEQIVATGLLRNSMLNEEGAIIPEQFRMVEMFDRMDCIGKAFLGLSTQCAQCHTHKYDPITMKEYYGMFAYLNNTYEAKSWVYSAEQRKQRDQTLSKVAAARQRLRDRMPDWQQRLEAWSAELNAAQPTWHVIKFHDLNSVSGLNHPVQEPDGSVLMLGHTSSDVYMIAAAEATGVTGIRLEALLHGDLPFRGPGRSSVGGWAIRELEISLRKSPTDDWQPLKLVNATADFSNPDQKQEDGKAAVGPVAYLIDGNDKNQWKSDRGQGRRNAPSVAVVQFEQPTDFPTSSELKVVMRMSDMLGSCRFSWTTSAQPQASPVDYNAVLASGVPAESRGESEQQALFDAWRKTLEEASDINEEIATAWGEYPAALTSVLHLQRRDANKVRSTHRLDRGMWDQPVELIEPAVPAAFHPLEANDHDEPPRLQFARWLASDKSPFAARVAVNRMWQHVFGIGLVETSEDFGTRSPLPEYQALLDWLAVDFMEQGWSQKHLLRRIVTSEVYQQSSAVSEALQHRDPKNRLLARGPRFRTDAEVVRDIALSVSGLIHHQLGGPGVIPPVPKNVLDYNYVYPSYWKPAEGEQRYRRAVYGFRKRSMPDPAMSSFDSPNGDFSCARRVRSNTPLAALTGLNEPIFVESARALGLRILREGGDTDASRIERAFWLCVSRAPTKQEREVVSTLLRSRRAKIADGWLDARELATGDPAKLPELPDGTTPQDAAAWTIVARVLLNLDETISKN